MRVRWSLAGQVLALQLTIVLLVLVAVAAVSLEQSRTSFEETEARRLRSVAEYVTQNSLVRPGRAGDGLRDPKLRAGLGSLVVDVAKLFDASYLVIAGADQRIYASLDPSHIGGRLDLSASDVFQGRLWQGDITEDGVRTLVARVPVMDRQGEVIGAVAMGNRYPTWWEALRAASPNLLTYLGIASLLGVAGSLLLARLVKRQTLGLEPREIAGLVEHREAMLHGVKEGMVGLDLQHRVTVANDEALALLSLPPDSPGRTLTELGVGGRLLDVLTGKIEGQDVAVAVGQRVLLLNRMPIFSRKRLIGSVTTLRDRTEVASMQRELDVTRHTTGTLRAQAHEFSNQLHIISGLVELQSYEEVVSYIRRLSRCRAQLNQEVSSRVADTASAALLIAKSSQASELGVTLRLSEATQLGEVDEPLSADLVTVVGNLVDNALDAARATRDAWVDVEIAEGAEDIQVVVRDSGLGVPANIVGQVFAQGFSTKDSTDAGGRGFGLALIRLVCDRRGGEVSVRNEGGAVFAARLPKRAKVAV